MCVKLIKQNILFCQSVEHEKSPDQVSADEVVNYYRRVNMLCRDAASYLINGYRSINEYAGMLSL